MKPPQDHSSVGPRGICCELAAFAFVRLPHDSLPAIRRRPEQVVGFEVPASTFKHLDAQSVAGLAAISRAVQDFGVDPGECHDWGVLAAPHFIGQTTVVPALVRFRSEGAWGVSPHVIPHHSLHSVSGTVSQVLKIHGPNLGIGGGRGGTGEALLAAAAWLGRRQVPGVWVVLTTLDPQTTLGDDGQPPPGTACVGLAMALVPAKMELAGLRLRIYPRDDAHRADRPLDLFTLHAALEQGRTARGAGGLAVGGATIQIELEWVRPVRSLPTPAFLLRTGPTQPAIARLSTGAETPH